MRAAAILATVLLLAACGSGAERRDTAAAPAATSGPNANPVDTAMRSTANDSAAAAHNMAGMRHDSMARGAADTARRSTAPR